MKNSTPYKLIVVVLFVAGLSQAQVRKKSVPTKGINVETKKEANDFFILGDYNSARDAFLNVYKLKPENTEVNFKLGYCYLVTHTDQSKAIPFLEFAAKQTDAPKDINYYLGRAYLINNRYSDAIKAFEKAKLKGKHDPILGPDPKKQIEICHTAEKLTKSPVDVKFENLGRNINSPYAEYNPFVSSEQAFLIFSSKRKLSTEEEEAGGQLTSDLYISTPKQDQWQKAKIMDNSINTQYQEESVGLSADGQNIFIYADNTSNSGDILTSHFENKKWSAPKSLGNLVNSKGIEKGATLSPDGEVLYFSSDRKGGFGGFDLYKSKKLPTGEWGLPINLGPVINTQYDEDAPIICADSKTFYFSSMGHESMGGFDILKTTWNDSTQTWAKPVNIGYPINTADDNMFFSISNNGQYGFISAYRPEGYGDMDIYKVTFNEVKRNNQTIVKGKIVTENSTNPVIAEINLYDSDNGKLLGVYKPNSSSGSFVMVASSGCYNMEIFCDGFPPFKEEVFIPEFRQPEMMTKRVTFTK